MKFKGIELEGTYKVRYYSASFEVFNEKGNMFYREESDDYWSKREYDEKGNEIYFENSYGCWSKSKHNEKGSMIYNENNDGYWVKWEYNEEGKVIYYENSKGKIIDERVRELTIEQIEKLLGYKIKIKG